MREFHAAARKAGICLTGWLRNQLRANAGMKPVPAKPYRPPAKKRRRVRPQSKRTVRVA
jgi:hypothetical protein